MTDQSTTPTAGSNGNGAHPPTFVDKGAAYRNQAEAAELLRSDAGDVTAQTVTLDRSGAEQITADRVTLTQSGAKGITAKSAQLDNSGALTLKSDNAVLHGSTVLALSANTARVVKSSILFFRSDLTTVEGEIKTLVHVGQACDNVKPVFDGKGALRFGGALGLTLLVGGRLLRRLFGR